MNKTLVLIGLGITALISNVAGAATSYGYNGLYVGASVGEILYDEEGLDQLRPTILLARAGQQFSPYLAIEGRLGSSVNSGDSNGFHINAETIFAGYAKGIWPFSPVASGYALVGLGGTRWSRNYPDFNSTDVGFSFGLGAEFKLPNSPASLTAEWVRLVSGNNAGFDYTANQLTFGVNWHF